jgi:5-methylcytosine-specific restriction endonuclease McrA
MDRDNFVVFTDWQESVWERLHMTTPSSAQKIEAPQAGATHCLDEMPYRTIIFARMNSQIPLYWVAGVAGGPWGADNALRKAFVQHGGSCFYCKKPIAAAEMTIDHVESKKLGGSGSAQNLVLAHKACNAAKNHVPIEAFNPQAGREWLQALLKQVEDRLRKLDGE